MYMYLQILKKDLIRKKTMNAVLLIFIILASMFIASSTNNMIRIITALDKYFEMADVPDYWFATTYKEEAERFQDFADNENYGLTTVELIQINPKEVTVNKNKFEYSNSVVLSAVHGTKIFDKNETEITHINDGEIYITSEIFHLKENNFYEGCKIEIGVGDRKKEFTLKGYTRDALFGSSMIGMTRFLISDHDFEFFYGEDKAMFFSLAVYTRDASFMEKFNDLNLQTTMNVNRSGIKMMYIMDTLIAAVILVVSICLILISMVILRFTIHFTIEEEFREIGVMKAIGIPNNHIRSLYIVKYFTISIIGAILGLILSFPFGNLFMESVSRNIIIFHNHQFFWGSICALATAALVIFYCYFCTRKIKKISPIDAIRNGETGERYSKNGWIYLNKSRIKPVIFLAINDIFTDIKRYLSMVLIFTLGILLVIIPVNTINTLQSDKLITLFNMADCDLVITEELFFSSEKHNEDMIYEKLNEVRKTLDKNNIKADVFQEIMFRFSISYKGKKTSSLAFQGVGGVTTDQYDYLKGTPPRNEGEIAVSYITADKINANIGDEVEIDMGGEKKKYIITAINQTMNNLGEGIRFCQEEKIDYGLAAGNFGIQILYQDVPNKKIYQERKELLQELYSNTDVFSAGEYISYMTGDVAGQLEGVKSLILGIIICINSLVVVLMVKSFLTKEKGEIAMMKAIGFKNSSLIAWQSIRIAFVLFLSIVIGTIISEPISKIVIEPIFRMMGAYRIEFDIVFLEVYIIYPCMVLIITVAAAILTSMQLKSISVSETSNIE